MAGSHRIGIHYQEMDVNMHRIGIHYQEMEVNMKEEKVALASRIPQICAILFDKKLLSAVSCVNIISTGGPNSGVIQAECFLALTTTLYEKRVLGS